MDKENRELTKGSEYKITSLGTKDRLIETEGVFEGFISVGMDGTGVLIKLGENHGDMKGKIRIVPLHAILLIDVLNEKENENKDSDKGMSHYVG